MYPIAEPPQPFVTNHKLLANKEVTVHQVEKKKLLNSALINLREKYMNSFLSQEIISLAGS